MKRLFVLAILFATISMGLVYGPRLDTYDGYILIVMENGTLQLSIFGAFLTLLGLVLAVWVTYRLVKVIWNVLFNTQKWLANLGHVNRQKALAQGVGALMNAHPKEAIALLEKVRGADLNGLQLLALGHAYQLNGQNQEAETAFEEATTHSYTSLRALESLYTLYLQIGTPNRILLDIPNRNKQTTSQPAIIQLHANALLNLGKWDTLEDALNKWKKPLAEHYAYYKQAALKGRLSEVASKEGAIQLNQTWEALPRKTRKDPAQQVAYVQQLIEQGMHHDAEAKLLAFTAKQDDVSQFLPLFKQLQLASPTASIKQLEKWIKVEGNNPQLYSALGHLAFHSHDFILAEKALAKAIALSEDREDIALLAQIKEQSHQNDAALALYKRSTPAS
ncbi:hypothetical protein OE749_15920 [Aestuariibacter sp. AA17]|uniref:HemY N-terminal domain-containing protein n=1 Tax=Fluctibacter corallii TaxID=2984329 RepID=A0ABT3ABY3_9ALTE|nr:heme biosynthesis HemY N-terminal domain-containing protein [Aestuariibacter sp. AA17]MCV2886180.1 hypothetical protein [Aestuariibacter sp. AA17]